MYNIYSRACPAANRGSNSATAHKVSVSVATRSAYVDLTCDPLYTYAIVLCVSLFRTHNVKTRNLLPHVCPTELIVAGATTTSVVQHLP